MPVERLEYAPGPSPQQVEEWQHLASILSLAIRGGKPVTLTVEEPDDRRRLFEVVATELPEPPPEVSHGA